MTTNQRCEEFLHRYGMHYDTIDMRKELKVFIEEMEAGLKGEQSTLMMLPTYLGVDSNVPTGTPIIVMDAGGTNFRVASVTFRAGNSPLIESFEKYTMPGSQGTISREEFFDTIAKRLLPVIGTSERVGFCYSYPSEIQPNRDGMFIKFSKEVSVDGLLPGMMIGEGINEALAKLGQSPKEFIILNDTVAAMLGGIAQQAGTAEKSDGHIGFILGTGTNTCYPELCSNITKAPEAVCREGTMAVNVESGGYGRFPRGEMDERYDATTKTPGQYKFEKMVSGAYQGGILYLTILQAIEDGLFSDTFREGFARWKELIPLWEVDQFCDAPQGDNTLADLVRENEDDRNLLLAIFDASYERAARLVAINLGAVIKKMGRGENPESPVCITAEGTTFQKSRLFREKLDGYVKSFLNGELGVYCRFLTVEDATLLGTAVAGLIG